MLRRMTPPTWFTVLAVAVLGCSSRPVPSAAPDDEPARAPDVSARADAAGPGPGIAPPESGPRWRKVVDGLAHSCALDRRGAVWCWGDNRAGQAGPPVAGQGWIPPTRIPEVELVDVAVAGDTSCAAHADGRVSCWGAAVGGSTPTVDSSNVDVMASLAGPASAKPGHRCTISDDGEAISCRGANAWRQLGRDEAPQRKTIELGRDALEISEAPGGLCARLKGGAVWCWQVLDDTIGLPRAIGIADATDLEGSEIQACAVRRKGLVSCWGAIGAKNGEPVAYGDGATPTAIAGLQNAVEVSVGRYHACALLRGAKVSCWGRIGGDIADKSKPTVPIALAGTAGAVSVAAGDYDTQVVRKGGTMRCWGDCSDYDANSKRPVEVPRLDDAVRVIAAQRSCVIRAGGAVTCFGNNQFRALGGGAGGSHDERRADLDVPGVIDLADHREGSCAVTGAGEVWCWGQNTHGIVGDGTTARRRAPAAVDGIDNAIQVVTTERLTCARLADGKVTCWGAVPDAPRSDELRPVLGL